MKNNQTVSLSFIETEKLALEALTHNGVQEEPSKAVIRAYLEAEKCGKRSHGLQLIPWVLNQLKKAKPQTPFVLSETQNSLLIDGAENPGPYVAEMLVKKLVQLTETNPMAMGGIRNAGHIGMLSYYANLLAQQNRIAIIFATTPSVTAPFEGKEPVLGTNPFCIGVPTGNDPIILDASTTAITYHSLLKAKESGEQLPPNVVLDKQGNPTQDPTQADPTRLLTFGGYKGFGLSLMVELLTAALTGWKIGSEKAIDIANDRFSTTMIVVRADVFVSQPVFFEQVEKLKSDIAHSQGVENPRLPFSQSIAAKQKAGSAGVIEIPIALLDKLKELAGQA